MSTEDSSSDADPPTSQVHRDSDNFLELPPGSVVDDTYEVDAKLGAGAMGEVYAARHMKLGKRVAIKVIGQRLSQDADAIERFALEARTLAQIQHPAIVAVEHVGELTDGRAYFVMEFLRGGVLFDRLSRGRVPMAEALRILDQMARGLDAAHGEGVIHRDLKPENVFLVYLPGEEPIVKIVDFGLAKIRGPAQQAARTQSGVALGTPMYMSPEQMRGQGVDYRTDIYALGCVAYELLLGVHPFSNAHTVPELYAAHLHEVPPLPRAIWTEIPPQLDLVLFAMLAKDPAHRPTLEQVRAVIATVMADRPGDHAATVFVRAAAARSRSRRSWMAAAAVVLLVGGIAIGTRLATGSAPSLSAPQLAPTQTPITIPAQVPARAPSAALVTVVPIETKAETKPPETPRSATPRRQVLRPAVVAAPSVLIAVIDAGVPDAPPDPPPKPDPPPPKPKPKAPSSAAPVIDRDQTINPFKHEVNP
jgi:serine/threonine-protein kinase